MKSKTSTLLIDNYLGLLNSLSKENKIELIAKLSKSMVNEMPKSEDVIDRFYGAFKSEKSAEEMIKEIHDSRMFNRTIEAF